MVDVIWLFDTNGFTSVVAYDPTKDFRKSAHKAFAEASSDPKGWLLIRARIKDDLVAIEKIIGHDINIVNDKSADYSHRALVSRDDWKAYLSAQVDEIDYDSHFKEVVRARAPKHPRRYSAMMGVWSAMADLQDTVPYSGKERPAFAGTYSGTESLLGKDDWDEFPSGDTFTYGTSGVSTVRSSHSTWKPKPAVEPAELSPVFFTSPQMEVALTNIAPKDIDIDAIANASDPAFALWMLAMDKSNDGSDILTAEDIAGLTVTLGILNLSDEFEDDDDDDDDVTDRDFALADRDIPEDL